MAAPGVGETVTGVGETREHLVPEPSTSILNGLKIAVTVDDQWQWIGIPFPAGHDCRTVSRAMLDAFSAHGVPGVYAFNSTAPTEEKACLLELDGVADAAVFGVPHPDLGEVVAGYIQRLPGAALGVDDVTAHVHSRLARYKAPREIVFVDELPREDTGKLFRRRLKEQHARRLGQGDETQAE